MLYLCSIVVSLPVNAHRAAAAAALLAVSANPASGFVNPVARVAGRPTSVARMPANLFEDEQPVFYPGPESTDPQGTTLGELPSTKSDESLLMQLRELHPTLAKLRFNKNGNLEVPPEDRAKYDEYWKAVSDQASYERYEKIAKWALEQPELLKIFKDSDGSDEYMEDVTAIATAFYTGSPVTKMDIKLTPEQVSTIKSILPKYPFWLDKN
eukprot:NODE_629_length_5810_cov_0.426895.p2 type:complete len:211 gc:universal NODE_629_length_5810_cov_0.426895:3151-2519(-)